VSHGSTRVALHAALAALGVVVVVNGFGIAANDAGLIDISQAAAPVAASAGHASHAGHGAAPGTVVSRLAPVGADGRVRFGHPSGMLSVGAEAREEAGQWSVKKVMMSRSARRLMEGWVRVPA